MDAAFQIARASTPFESENLTVRGATQSQDLSTQQLSEASLTASPGADAALLHVDFGAYHLAQPFSAISLHAVEPTEIVVTPVIDAAESLVVNVVDSMLLPKLPNLATLEEAA